MRYLPRPLSGPVAACVAVAALSLTAVSLAAGPAMAAVPRVAGHPAAVGHGAAARQARVIARASIRRLTARWHATARPGSGNRAVASTTVSSTSWGGYADLSETYSKATGKWAQPAVTCSTAATSEIATWVGLDGYSSDTVEQAGTLAECYQRTAYYYSWWELYPDNDVQVVGASVAAGDAITGSVSRSGTTYTFKVTDATHTANSFSATSACSPCVNSSAEWIAGANAGSTVVIPAISWTVSGATVTAGSVTGVISTFPYSQIVPVNGSTSPLNAAGNGFTVTWARTTP